MKKRFTRWLGVALLSMFVLPLMASTGFAQQSFIFRTQGGDVEVVKQRIAEFGGAVTRVINLDGQSLICADGPERMKAEVRRLNGVLGAANDFEFQGIDPSMTTELGVEGSSFTNPPNSGDDDFFFDLQWGHDAVNAPEAWRKRRGAGVVVAILDSGIDADHGDLAPNLNTDLSMSFVPGEDYDVQPGFYFNHGTHVAGTIGAADNGFGTIGVAPEAELVALKVLSEFTGSGDFGWLMDAIVYAADNGVDIANMSLGALFPMAGQIGSQANELKDMLEAVGAYANSKGLMLIASAGNEATNLDAGFLHLPSDARYFVSVSASAPIGWATDPYNANFFNLAGYSNYGSNSIDFAAPGGDVQYPGEENCIVGGLDRPCWVFDLVFSTISEGWGWSGGTSMAAPHVTGVAALYKSWKKNASPDQIRNALKASAYKIGDNPGDDEAFGKGHVNGENVLRIGRGHEAGDLVTDALTLDSSETPEAFQLSQNYPNPFNPTTNINFQLAEQADVHVAVYDLMGRQIATLVNQELAAGSYETSWNGQDASGNLVASGVYMYKITAGSFVSSKVMTLLK